MQFNINTINPYIRVSMRSILPKGFEIKKRVIFDYELIYVESGEFTLNYNNINFNCTSGQFVLLRPDVAHSFNVNKTAVSQPHIHFDFIYSHNSAITPVSFKDKPEFSEKELTLLQKDIFENYPQTPFVNFTEKEKVLELFYPIVNKELSTLESKANLIKIIEMLVRENFPDLFTANQESYSIAQQLKDYIDAGQGLSAQLKEIENQFSYSKYYLERQFKKEFGISLIAYRNQKRMETAEKLLKTESVSDVADKLGFSSIYAFSRAYKNHFGASPTVKKGLSH